MASSIYRLVYYSCNYTASDDSAFAADVDQILPKSRVNNRRDNITVNASGFAKVLEGPLETVKAAFERVQQDERHGDVSLLALDAIDDRSFPNWAMGFISTSQINAKRFADVGSSSGFDPSRLTGDEIHSLLREVAIEEQTA